MIKKARNNSKYNSLDKRMIAIYIIVIIGLVLGISYALNQSGISFSATSSKFKIAYSSEFDSSNLKFSPILDQNVEENVNNVIKITFRVGGEEENPDVETIYDVSLVDLEVDSILKSNYIKWKLIKNDKELSHGDFKDLKESTRLVLTGTQQDLPKYNEAKDEYIFYLWFSDSCQELNPTKCTESESQNQMLNKTLAGKIEVELYTGNKKNKTIMLNLDPMDGETTTQSLTAEYNQQLTNLPTPTRTGYTFIGWYDSFYKDHPLYYYADINSKIKSEIGYDEDKLYQSLKTNSTDVKTVSQYSNGSKLTLTTNSTLYAGWVKN